MSIKLTSPPGDVARARAALIQINAGSVGRAVRVLDRKPGASHIHMLRRGRYCPGEHSMIGRRTLLATTAAMLATPAIVGRVGAQSTFDWKHCKGQTIVVSLTKNPRADNLQAHQKEFEALTGIRVESEQMPEQQQRPKMVMELASGNPSFDVTHYSLHVSKRVVGVGHWLEDLRPYLANPTLTAPEYDWADMSAGALRAATQPDGRIDSLPVETDVWLVYYNKQIFADRGLAFPQTFDEMLATARKINDPANGIYGFVARGVKNANVPVWTSLLLGQDQETVTPDGRTLLTDTPEAVWAGGLYKSLLHECAPPGVVGFNWNECQTSFMQGKIGMWLDGVGFTPPLLDPKVSKIVDRVGFGLMPARRTIARCSPTPSAFLQRARPRRPPISIASGRPASRWR
jgi:multiple sugar transport system substrate-binding protein